MNHPLAVRAQQDQVIETCNPWARVVQRAPVVNLHILRASITIGPAEVEGARLA